MTDTGLVKDSHPDKSVPFGKGNAMGETHASYSSPARLDSNGHITEICEWIIATQPVSHPADWGAAWRLACVYRRLALSAQALDAADEAIGERPMAAYVSSEAWLIRLRDDHARWLREAARIEEALGRTPASRARLGLHMALGQRALSLIEMHAVSDEVGS